MSTTAEGVETEEQLNAVREQGCNEVQGFLFSPPMPSTAVRVLLEATGGLGFGPAAGRAAGTAGVARSIFASAVTRAGGPPARDLLQPPSLAASVPQHEARRTRRRLCYGDASARQRRPVQDDVEGVPVEPLLVGVARRLVVGAEDEEARRGDTPPP